MDNTEENALRLQVFLAKSGIASRRASEKLILAGRVQVNGVVVRELGTKVLPSDRILFDGKDIRPEETKHYIALNKPVDYICASKDPQGRRLAVSLLGKSVEERLYNVGRLDYRSSGLLLFTNDGDFARDISHPSTMIEKEYLVEASGIIPDMVLTEFSRGIEIEGILYRCSAIERTDRRSVRITLIEGKNREIRRVFSHFHLHPKVLHRVRIGPVNLGLLGSGESRELVKTEMDQLRDIVAKNKGDISW